MTGTTLNSTILDRNPAVNMVPNAQKTVGKTQDFGDVLGKAAQKIEQTGKTGADNTKTDTTPKNTDSAAKPVDENTAAENVVNEETVTENTAETKEPVEEKTSETTKGAETSETKEPVDEMTADEIVNALEQIVEQIKQILGITDEELLSGMESLDMTKFDLLNPDNMAQLVATVSGEDSVISLVADEKLYAALQDISEMVETQVKGLLDKTELTEEELDIVVQKLQELETKEPEGEKMLTVEPETDVIPEELQEKAEADADLGTAEAGDDTNVEQLPETRTPVIIKEDKTEPTKQYDKLPDNQQENPVETITDSKTRDTQRDAKHENGKESKNFGQNGASQNFRNTISEMSESAATQGTAKFTSESTENILRQLADMVKIVKNENLTEMELQLHPASLGTVNVSLTTKGGVVTAQFTTQNEAVKTAIEAQVSQLQANLEEQGVKVEAVEVSVASHEMERNLDKDGRGEQQQAEQENAQRIQGARRRSINLRTLGEGGESEDEMAGADDATRIAMEMMAANGNSMDLLA